MATVDASWLTKGYFVLRDDGLMREARDVLEKSLRMPTGSLRVRMFPEERKWKHTVWWRQGSAPYKEAQFFAQIARGFPVLSLGVAVEKGYRSVTDPKDRAKRMDRTWDWHHLIANAKTILGPDIRSMASRLRWPVTFRVRHTPVTADGSTTQAYSFANGKWYERYEGRGAESKIVKHLKKVNGMQDHWAIVHLACDLDPKEADGLTARDLAATLILFNNIRKRLRGQA
jgi:hypothetical protein